MERPARQQTREKRMPVFIVRALSVDGRGRQQWTSVGAAWERKNGEEGFTVRLHALPLSGTLVLLPPMEEEEVPDDAPDYDPASGEVR